MPNSKDLIASGTLVCAVPTGEGLIFAADSRSSFGQLYCDVNHKILLPSTTKRIAISVTGNGVFYQAPIVPITNLCDFLSRGLKQFDAEAEIQEYLKNIPNFSNLNMQGLSEYCLRQTSKYQASSPNTFHQFLGRDIFRVVIAGFNSEHGKYALESFAISLTSFSSLYIRDRYSRQFNPTDPIDVCSFGETDYLNSNVFGGIGGKFLSPQSIELLTSARKIADVGLSEGVELAANVINAASETTSLIPAPTGIGGPVDIVAINSTDYPKKIRWK